VPQRRGSPWTWNSGSNWARQDSDYRARSDLAGAELALATADEFPRLWAEADATLHVGRGTP
jgi:hypothetical protein